MKKILAIALVGLITILASCTNNPQTGYYDDQSYQQQQPILVNSGGQSFLMDYLLYQNLMQRNINPGYYYNTHRNDVHIHISNGHGGYNGYRGNYARTYRPVTRSYTRSYSRPINTGSSSTPRTYSLRPSSSSSSRSSFGSSRSFSSSPRSYSLRSSSSSRSSSHRR